jgi:hypothetical protein
MWKYGGLPDGSGFPLGEEALFLEVLKVRFVKINLTEGPLLALRIFTLFQDIAHGLFHNLIDVFIFINGQVLNVLHKQRVKAQGVGFSFSGVLACHVVA